MGTIQLKVAKHFKEKHPAFDVEWGMGVMVVYKPVNFQPLGIGEVWEVEELSSFGFGKKTKDRRAITIVEVRVLRRVKEVSESYFDGKYRKVVRCGNVVLSDKTVKAKREIQRFRDENGWVYEIDLIKNGGKLLAVLRALALSPSVFVTMEMGSIPSGVKGIHPGSIARRLLDQMPVASCWPRIQ